MISELALIDFSFKKHQQSKCYQYFLYLPCAHPLGGRILAVELLLFEKIFDFKYLFVLLFVHLELRYLIQGSR